MRSAEEGRARTARAKAPRSWEAQQVPGNERSPQGLLCPEEGGWWEIRLESRAEAGSIHGASDLKADPSKGTCSAPRPRQEVVSSRWVGEGKPGERPGRGQMWSHSCRRPEKLPRGTLGGEEGRAPWLAPAPGAGQRRSRAGWGTKEGQHRRGAASPCSRCHTGPVLSCPAPQGHSPVPHFSALTVSATFQPQSSLNKCVPPKSFRVSPPRMGLLHSPWPGSVRAASEVAVPTLQAPGLGSLLRMPSWAFCPAPGWGRRCNPSFSWF